MAIAIRRSKVGAWAANLMTRLKGMFRFSLLLSLLITSSAVWSHGDVHHRLRQLSRQIDRDPENIDLLLKRGEMYLVERHGDEAFAEFNRVLALAPQRHEVWFLLAKSQMLLNHHDQALASVDQYLQKADNDASRRRGQLLKGEILSVAGHWQAAGNAYLQAIELSNPVEPDSVLFAVAAFRQGGNIDQALAVLQTGIERLGPLAALHEQALELEMLSGRYDAALRRVEEMLAGNQRLAFLLYQKGVILKALARQDEAKLAFDDGLRAIANLPADKQKTPVLEKLKASLQQASLSP